MFNVLMLALVHFYTYSLDLSYVRDVKMNNNFIMCLSYSICLWMRLQKITLVKLIVLGFFEYSENENEYVNILTQHTLNKFQSSLMCI